VICSHNQRSGSKAFTLVELLLVLTMIGLLAAIVIPKFSNASAVAREAMLADQLRMIRMQVAVFRSQHLGVAPGYPDCDTSAAPTQTALVNHLTMASDAQGDTANPGTVGYDYGPYIFAMVENPVNGKSTVEIIGDDEAFPEAGDDSHGFIYKPATLAFKADSAGTDENGKSFFDY